MKFIPDDVFPVERFLVAGIAVADVLEETHVGSHLGHQLVLHVGHVHLALVAPASEVLAQQSAVQRAATHATHVRLCENTQHNSL